MLNCNINFDLHIHSYMSKYKEFSKDDENKTIVDNSTIENLNVIFNKLNQYNINMFSFSDHNRFSSDLYFESKKILKQNIYPNVKAILPSVEFDVILEEGMKECHILTIFDAKTDEEIEKIEYTINLPKFLLTNEKMAYKKDIYESLLKEIGLSTILIACQRKDLNNSNGKHRSLSDSTKTPYEMIKYQYINALEYQSNKVEGIIKNNLSKANLNIGLVTGSDCHDWNVYPFHDKKMSEDNKDIPLEEISYYSTIKCLPTFKGLLLSLTSLSTRFNRKSNLNNNYLSYVEVNQKKYEFSPGINAIIGENGSGKSTLLYELTNNNKKSHIKSLVSNNKISFDKKLNNSNVKFIEQSMLVKNYNDNNIFGEDLGLFGAINSSEFEEKFNNFFTSLQSKIYDNIDKNFKLSSLSKNNFTIIPTLENRINFFIDITYDKDFCLMNNKYLESYINIKRILSLLKIEFNNKIYTDLQRSIIKDTFINLVKLFSEIYEQYKCIEHDKYIKGIIKNSIDEYNEFIETNKTSKEKEKNEYDDNKRNLISSIISVIRHLNKNNPVLDFPKRISGINTNFKNGFKFNLIPKFHNEDLETEFYSTVFNNDYNSLDKVLNIKNRDEFINAIFRANSNNFEDVFLNRKEEFLKLALKSRKIILDESTNSDIGSTLGEMSLMYYKYFTYNDEQTQILIIDQPEDNISNYRVNESLIKYLNNLRDKKQIIIATHNPLLVVNLDVDNVIILQNNNGKIQCSSGCLEDEDEKILDQIAKIMDGGKEVVKRRLEFYEDN